MDESGITEKMVLFGLTRQEASIYLCLAKNGSMTGYEVAKQTGISRSNVYSALAGLSGKGAAYLMEGNASRYIAAKAEEFCDNHIRRLQEVKSWLQHNLPQNSESREGYITVEGHRHIMDKIHHMLLSAGQRVYLSASAGFIEALAEELAVLAKKNIKVVLITEKALERLREENITLYLQEEIAEEGRRNQIRLIIDSSYVLTGDVEGEDTDTCLYCAQKNFVTVFKEAMRNEIRLIQLQSN